jgi:hypothetical protein
MIHKRRAARNRRVELQRVLLSQIEDLQIEDNFEDSLAAQGGGARFEPCFSGQSFAAAWRAPLYSNLGDIQAAYDRDAARAARPAPPELLAQLKAARREKVANKTRERERQMRGEVLSATRRQSRVGFPAHALARWDPEARKANLLARRSAGVVGYVGQVKRALGHRIPPEDDGLDESARRKLDRLVEEIRRINESRRSGETLTEGAAERSVVRQGDSGAA